MLLGAMYAILRSRGDIWGGVSCLKASGGIADKANLAKPPHKRKKIRK